MKEIKLTVIHPNKEQPHKKQSQDGDFDADFERKMEKIRKDLEVFDNDEELVCPVCGGKDTIYLDKFNVDRNEYKYRCTHGCSSWDYFSYGQVSYDVQTRNHAIEIKAEKNMLGLWKSHIVELMGELQDSSISVGVAEGIKESIAWYNDLVRQSLEKIKELEAKK